MSDLPTPINRNEQYLNAIANGDPSDLPTPITREEQYLDYIAKNGGGSGGAGVSSFNGRTGAVVPKSGDYTAAQVGALPANTQIPSKTSDLQNDSGFIAESSFDSVPTQNSTHGVQSGGVYSAEKAISDNISALEENGAKNLLPLTLEGLKSSNVNGTWSGNDYTHNGTTFTILTNSNGSVTGIKANGTPATNDGSSLFINSDFEITDETEYIVNGVTGGSSSTYTMACYWRDANNTYAGSTYISNGDKTIKVSDKPGAVKINTFVVFISEGYTANNTMFYPMIRDARITDPTYAPYAMTNRELTEQMFYKAGDVLDFTTDFFYGFEYDGVIYFDIPLNKPIKASSVSITLNEINNVGVVTISGLVTLSGLSVYTAGITQMGVRFAIRATSLSGIPQKTPVIAQLLMTVTFD